MKRSLYASPLASHVWVRWLAAACKEHHDFSCHVSASVQWNTRCDTSYYLVYHMLLDAGRSFGCGARGHLVRACAAMHPARRSILDKHKAIHMNNNCAYRSVPCCTSRPATVLAAHGASVTTCWQSCSWAAASAAQVRGEGGKHQRELQR